MQDETLSHPLPLPATGRSWRALVLVALLAFALGAIGVAWLVRTGQMPAALMGASRPAATPLAAAAPRPAPSTPVQPAQALGAVETRLALLEDRLTRIDGEASAASGNAARAEALLVALAARRRIEQGQPLGYVEEQLTLRFGGAQPQAVQALITAARTAVTLDELDAQLEAATAVLSGKARDEGTWARMRRELASLFVVRRAPIPSTGAQERIARARLMLASGEVDEAIAEIERLPGADSAQAWIAAARRYGETQRALAVIETAAMLEPRGLRDDQGRAVTQPSPLAPPADAADEVLG